MSREIKLITNIKVVDVPINSEYGLISYEAWCLLEAERIGNGAYVKYEKHNKVNFCCVAK